jgi:hypothetical protein
MKEFHALHHLQRREMRYFKMHKSGALSDDGIMARYKQFEAGIDSFFAHEKEFVKLQDSLLDELSDYLSYLRRRVIKYGMRLSVYEITIEKKLSNGRNKYIRKHQIGVKRQVMANRKAARMERSAAKRHMRHFQRGRRKKSS